MPAVPERPDDLLHRVHLRAAGTADLDLLRRWERADHVVAAGAQGWDWEDQLGQLVRWRLSLIAECDGQPVGFIETIDPRREPSGLLAQAPPGDRGIDIWIGEADRLGSGIGTRMMTLAISACFAEPGVSSVFVDPLQSNHDAHRFYRRLGFADAGEARIDGDHCRMMVVARKEWQARWSDVPAGGEEVLLEAWFGPDAPDAEVAQRQAGLWWSKDPQTDRTLRERFEPWVHAAASGALDGWLDSPRGWLAHLLLTDQLPRNLFRDSPLAFAFDALARVSCRAGLAAGHDRELAPVQRVFAYLPLEHSESLSDQDDSVSLFTQLAGSVGPGAQAAFDGFLDFAQRHREVVARFGRFPHRNRILQRASTADEVAFLETPGSSF